MQQTGRAGRDGDRSTALLYYNASDIGNNVSAMDNAMRDYCRSETCLRHVIANYFLYNTLVKESLSMIAVQFVNNKALAVNLNKLFVCDMSSVLCCLLFCTFDEQNIVICFVD